MSVLYRAYLCMKCSFGISDVLEEIPSLSHSVVFLYFFALIAEEGFLIYYSILIYTNYRPYVQIQSNWWLGLQYIHFEGKQFGLYIPSFAHPRPDSCPCHVLLRYTHLISTSLEVLSHSNIYSKPKVSLKCHLIRYG